MAEQSEQFRNSQLRPWRPGECGNPKGRPKGRKDSLRASLRRYLRTNPSASILEALARLGVDTAELARLTTAEGLAEVLIVKALSGDVAAAKLIIRHTERPLKVDGEGGAQISLVIPSYQEGIEFLQRRGHVILPQDRARLLLGEGEPESRQDDA